MKAAMRHSRAGALRLSLAAAAGLCVASAAESLPPLTVTLTPSVAISALPAWENGTNRLPVVRRETSSVDLPVPSLATQEEIGCFALTAVFDDQGDGGPVVEWIAGNGERTLLSPGLGETGLPVGLNARTLLIPQSVALDGGTARVSYAGRFDRLVSLTLRPARELDVAAIPSDLTPGLIGKTGEILSARDVSGQDAPVTGGDRTDGSVVHAELSPAAVRLDAPGASGSAEFVVPLSCPPSGCQLRAEVSGLDPESWIEVSLNGENRGVLAPAAFSLDDPSVLIAPSALRIAGWRASSLYLPARLWNAGDNSLVLTLHRSAGDSGNPVHLRNVTADLIFASPAAIPAVPPPSSAANASPSPAETLSTGAIYGNPPPSLFHAAGPSPLPAAPPPSSAAVSGK